MLPPTATICVEADIPGSNSISLLPAGMTISYARIPQTGCYSRSDRSMEIPMSQTRPPDQAAKSHALLIYQTGMAVLRNTNPTLDPTLYGNATEIFGDQMPQRWAPDEVRSVFNLSGILACGLENFGTMLAGDGVDQKAIDHETAWMVDRLQDEALPLSVIDSIWWKSFCLTLAGRQLGKSLAVTD